VEDFSSNLCVQTGSGVHPTSCAMGIEDLPRGKCGRGVLLTLLVPWVRKERGYTSSPPLRQKWHVTGDLYLLLFYCLQETRSLNTNISLVIDHPD
jgi:hypothetical protein